MIPNNVNTVQIEGSLGGRRIPMTIDPESLEHLVGLLTDLYSDEELACIREVSINGLDSHRKVGNKNPIHITTPNALSSFFKVKDYGVGLSVDDIERIYSKYGKSTKRETNVVTGSLGLGCKAPLTYTNSFSLVAVKNGVKVLAAIVRQEDNTGAIDIVDTVSTDEPDGVEISIPIKNRHTFNEKVERFFSFWEEGTVLVNGKPPEPFDYEIKVSDTLYVVKGGGRAWESPSSYIVMGNIPYPVERQHIQNLLGYTYNDYGFVAYVPMGAVNFPPARESLSYTNKTMDVIKDCALDLRTNISNAAAKKINEAPNHTEAYKTFLTWKNVLTLPAKYKGTPLVAAPIPWNKGLVFRLNAHRYAVQTANAIHLSMEHLNGVWIKNYKHNGSISALHKKKIRHYLAENSLTPHYVYLNEKMPDSVWLENVKVIDWTDIAAIRFQTAASGGSRKTVGKWDYINKAGQHWDEPDLPKGSKLTYISPREINDINLSGILTGLDGDVTIVTLGMNRWEKFQREHKGVYIKTYVREEIKRMESEISDEYHEFQKIDSSVRNLCRALNDQTIDDPEIVKVMDICNADFTKDIALANKVNTLRNYARQYNNAAGHGSVHSGLFSAYPLVNARHPEHTALYINAVYNGTEGNN